MKCYYEILEVARDADDLEIKTAYRKLALKWHPDKNIDNTELAKEQFQLVQQAYEVLSDRHERAWYDNHREQILRGSDSNYEDDSLDVFQYFTRQCFDSYDDNEKGFYTVYRKVFEQLAKEDIEYMDSKSDFDEIPTFGNSASDYDEVVGPFYAYWMSYNTRKSYVWLDPYNIKETRERRVLKLIEKENKKVRQKAKKERNEEVRNLVAFVRKRDKRVQAHAKLLEAKNAENRLKQEQLRKQKILERKRELNNDNAQAEWSKFDNVELELKQIEKSLAQEFGESISDSESNAEEEECEDLYCVACNKVFKNPKAFANHESSKKHRENVEKLKLFMREEEKGEENGHYVDDENNCESESDSEVTRQKSKKKSKKSKKVIETQQEQTIENLETQEENGFQSESDSETVNSASKKKNKKNKKVIRIQQEHTSEDDHHEKLENESKIMFDKTETISEDDFDFGTSKKQKKKAKTKSPSENSQPKTNTIEINKENTTDNNSDKPISNKANKKSKINKSKIPIDIEDLDVSHCCVICKSNFSSKNKLFDHLKKTGHSVMLPQKPTKSRKK